MNYRTVIKEDKAGFIFKSAFLYKKIKNYDKNKEYSFQNINLGKSGTGLKFKNKKIKKYQNNLVGRSCYKKKIIKRVKKIIRKKNDTPYIKKTLTKIDSILNVKANKKQLKKKEGWWKYQP